MDRRRSVRKRAFLRTPDPKSNRIPISLTAIARIWRLNRYVINRELRFKADSPSCRLLVGFPLADHDEGPDALEMCTRLPVAVYP